MTSWNQITFQSNVAKQELEEFETLLRKNTTVSETDVKHFLQQRPQLIGALGLLNSSVDRINRWAMEVDIGGKHQCDIAVGNADHSAYTLIELEEAKTKSLFRSSPATSYFSTKFNHGYSQIVDWLCLLDGTQTTPQFQNYWGAATPPQFVGVLLIGRSPAPLPPDARQRIDWRSTKVKVNSYPILCLTYDDLVTRLSDKLEIIAGS